MMCSTPTSLKAAVNNEDSSEEKHKVAEILPTLFKLVHCPEERSVVVNSEARNYSVAWPQVISSSAKSSKRVASDPLCISPEGDIITRFCVKKNTLNNPIWDPLKPPECFRSQPSYDNVHKCPLPYKDFSIHGRHFCVMMTEPREWAPACELGVTDEDILELSMSEFTSLVDYFRRMGVTSVWLPVKRFGNYGPLLRRLPGEEYGDKFKMPDHLLLSWSPNQQPLRGECLKLNIPFDINSAVTLGTDDCNHKYPVACVYKPSSDMLVRLACPEHYFTSRYSNEQDRCLSVSKNNIPGSWEEANLKCFDKGGHLMKISSVQDNYLAEEIINDFDCKDGWIGARRKSSDKGYEWDLGINNSVEVGFVNWDPKLSFGEIVDGRGALNEHGFWALYNRTYKLKCSICETKIEIPRTELSLRHDPEANRLTLSVYSPKGLWKESEKEEASRVRSQRRTIATNQSREANSDDDQDEVNIVGSRVISVSIPGIGSDLPVPIPIVFKPLLSSLNKPSNQRTCAFWDFSFNSSTPSQSLGGWSGDGCVYAGHSLQGNEKGKNGLEVCVCTHLTHFAELILGPSAYRTLDKSKISDPNIQYLLINEKALDIISIVGCTISLFGVIGIVTTAAVFRSWRDKSGTKILLQLSLAIALQMVGYLLSNFNTRNKHTAIPIPEEEVSNYENNEIVSCPEGSKIAGDLMNYSYDDITICDPYLIDGEENIFCIILAAFNHYAILCGFSWMLVTAFLQFQRYVKVLGCTRPPRFLLKSTLFGWGIPLIPVCVMLMITPYSYVPSYHTTMCHLTGKSLYLGVILPASMFIFVNLFVFVKVIDSVLRGPDGKVRSNPDRNLVYSQLRLGVVLFFLLGLSWVFGIILSLNPNTIIFSYLFCLTATTQGFVMFLFFVVCDPSTRHLWIKLVSTWGKIACGLTFNTGEKLSNSNVSDSFRNIDCPKKEATKKQELSYENPVTDQTPVNDKKNSVQQNYSTDKKGWNDAKY
uniref:Uncharacterized protein n=1 Tax=Timema bartmani TaxID=61472 RepID=A0A7R9ENL4_9NEOP|nr:unnamed protein product [Timema bartmani]